MPAATTWVEIDAQALRSNIAALRSLLSPEVLLSGVVKANAYGHGVQEVVPIMLSEGIDHFCVDSVDEAMRVRAVAPTARIIILGYTLHDCLETVVEQGFDQTIYDAETVVALNACAERMGKVVHVHLKIETGMTRQGIWPEQVPEFMAILRSHSSLRLVGLSTHYANADEADSPAFAEYQTDRFRQAYAMVQAAGFEPTLVHLANSGATILYPRTHGTMVRPGISAYGFWPSRQTRNAARLSGRFVDFTPVLSWKTVIAQVKDVPMGTPVGYGCTETLRRLSKVAVIPVGYWDGYDRKLSSIGEVLVRGQICKVLGRIAMNMFAVDVTEVPNVSREDVVTLIGRGGKNRMRADDIADRTGTIHYEVTTRINPLIPRIIV